MTDAASLQKRTDALKRGAKNDAKHPSISDEAPYEAEWKAAVAAGKFKPGKKSTPK